VCRDMGNTSDSILSVRRMQIELHESLVAEVHVEHAVLVWRGPYTDGYAQTKRREVRG